MGGWGIWGGFRVGLRVFGVGQVNFYDATIFEYCLFSKDNKEKT